MRKIILIILLLAIFSNKDVIYGENTSYTLSAGSSITFTNQSSSGVSIDIDGDYDFAVYKSDGSVDKYGRGTKYSNLYVSKGERAVITNRGNYDYEVNGANEGFQPILSEQPALKVQPLEAAKSLTFTNATAYRFEVSVDGEYGFAVYKSDNSVEDYGRRSLYSNLYVSGGERAVVTNRGTETYTVYGAYEVFHPTESKQPALEEQTLDAKKSLTFTNKTAFGLTVIVDGNYGYAVYKTDNSVDNYGRANEHSHLYVSKGERAVVTNRGSEPYTVYGAYEVFHPIPSEQPALKEQPLDANKSLTFTNETAYQFNVDVDGSYGYAVYKTDNSVDNYGRANEHSHLYVSKGERAVVTNRGSEPYTVYGAYEVFHPTESKQPALKEEPLDAKKSLTFTNETEFQFSVSADGNYGYAVYKSDNSVEDYGRASQYNHLYVSKGERVVVTNRGTETYTVYGAYEVFHPTESEQPALKEEPLDAKKSLTFTNETEFQFSVSADGNYGYAVYKSDNSVEDYGRASQYNHLYVSKGERAVVTNRGTKPYTVYGAYEAFHPTESEQPALKEEPLDAKKSLTFTNETVNQFNVSVDGNYGYAIYKSDDSVGDYGRASQYNHVYVSKGERAVVTNRGTEAYTVYGAYEVFHPTLSEQPALKEQPLDAKKSLTFTNETANQFNVSADGNYGYAVYKNDNSVEDYGRASQYNHLYVSKGERAVVTNRGTEPYTVYGAYEVFHPTISEQPALKEEPLDATKSLTFTNNTANRVSVSVDGNYEFAFYNSKGAVAKSGESSKYSSLYVNVGELVVITNQSMNTYLVYGAYEVFVPFSGKPKPLVTADQNDDAIVDLYDMVQVSKTSSRFIQKIADSYGRKVVQ